MQSFHLTNPWTIIFDYKAIKGQILIVFKCLKMEGIIYFQKHISKNLVQNDYIKGSILNLLSVWKEMNTNDNALVCQWSQPGN